MPPLSRRQFITGTSASVGLMGLASGARANLARPERRLRLYHTHTGKFIDVVYKTNDVFVPEALESLNDFLGDFRTGEVYPLDAALFDLLHDIQLLLDNPDGVYEIISGYRSPKTNEALRSNGGGVARRSLHMQGKAVDVRLRGSHSRKLRDVARQLKRGGVGYYTKSDFVHVDTGRVRIWGD